MVFGIQIPVYYMLFIVVVGALLLAKTRFFRQIYYVGSNRKAANLSGIPADRILVILFVVMGTLAGFAGVVLASQLRAAVAQIGNGIELRVIAAVVIGGGSLAGGKGTVSGAILGALFMVLLGTVMIITGVSIYIQNMIVGAVLIGAVTLDAILQKKYGATV
jgi:ribose/xylose/arabinose/galactoside ABC-type transport system permease subunit